MPALHAPQTVLSLRHTPSWLLLALSAGFVNAVAFLACSRFVTHVTGTVTLIGMDARAVLLAIDYLLVLACFVIGAMTSARWIDVRYYGKKRPFYALPLVVVGTVLFGLALAGMHGAFGAFGGSIESQRDFVFLSILAFAMGLQNAAVGSSTGLVVRTTHLTGTATDLGVYLATAIYSEGDPVIRHIATRHAALRAGKIAAFAVGAGIGAALARNIEYASLFVPSGIVFGVTCVSFLPRAVRRALSATGNPGVRAVLSREYAQARRPAHYEPIPAERGRWLDQIREQPTVAANAYVHPAATVIGRVVLGEGVHVAADTSVRADEGTPFHIGASTNIQDGVVMHALKGKHVDVDGEAWAIYVGQNVSIAHDALVHGPCFIGDRTFIGFKAVVHDAVVGPNCFIGIGSVVVGVEIPEGRFVPHGRIVDTAEVAAALPRTEEAQRHFNDDVVEVNRGLAAAYRELQREREVDVVVSGPTHHAPKANGVHHLRSTVPTSSNTHEGGRAAEPAVWAERWQRPPPMARF
jgi:carbonic anhydrase/acetyltransferase-like protein (isoleucine patch superfamily)/uncharacterized membrane protein YoaK (UPF0700 family)